MSESGMFKRKRRWSRDNVKSQKEKDVGGESERQCQSENLEYQRVMKSLARLRHESSNVDPMLPILHDLVAKLGEVTGLNRTLIE